MDKNFKHSKKRLEAEKSHSFLPIPIVLTALRVEEQTILVIISR